GNDLLAGLDALGIAVVVEERPCGRRCWRGGGPEAARRLGGEGVHGGMQKDPRQVAGGQTSLEAFWALGFVPDGVGHPPGAGWTSRVSGTSPSIPCCAKRRLRRPMVSGWVPVSWARCVAVRSGQSSNGRMSSYRYCVGSRNGSWESSASGEGRTAITSLQAP